MCDCYIETHLEVRWSSHPLMWRAFVINRATGSVMYQTWPYRSEQSARRRAARWLRDEYRKTECLEMFS